tara:strand:+ start:2285 stop:2416 length:132 start_codon:yes stop_codon:yes gene_type:complete
MLWALENGYVVAAKVKKKGQQKKLNRSRKPEKGGQNSIINEVL